MTYKFYTVTHPDCCRHCYNMSWVGHEKRIHVADGTEEAIEFHEGSGMLLFKDRANQSGGGGRTGLFHLLCRCRAFAFEVVDAEGNLVYMATGDGGAGDSRYTDSDDAEVLEAVEEGVIATPSEGRKPTLTRGHDGQVRQRYREQEPHVRKHPGKPFYTVVSEAVTTLLNKVYKLFSNKEPRDNPND